MLLWHSGNNDDCHKASDYDQEKAYVVQHRQKTVAEDDERATGPGDQDERDIDVPWLNRQVWVEDGVHLYSYIGRDGDNRSQVKDPAEKVQRAREKANHSAVAGPGGNGRPVIDASCRWYRRR